MDSQTEPKKSLLKTFFEIKRPIKGLQSATLPRTKTKSEDDDNVSKERLFVRHRSYRKKNKYKKEKIPDEKYAVESESQVKRLCQQFELAQINQTEVKNKNKDEVIASVIANREEKLSLLKKINENVEVKKRNYEKNSKQAREKKIQSFVEAENPEETEEYRKSLITEMDIELANMKEDGFLDDHEHFLIDSQSDDVFVEDKETSMAQIQQNKESTNCDTHAIMYEENKHTDDVFDETILEKLVRNRQSKNADNNTVIFDENKHSDDVFTINDETFLEKMVRNKQSNNFDYHEENINTVNDETFLAKMMRNRESNDSDAYTVVFDENNESEENIVNDKVNDDLDILTNRFDDEFTDSLADDLENGLHIVEAYNDEGRELIEVQVVIDRRTINLETSQSLHEAFKQSDMVFYQKGDKSFNVIHDIEPEDNASKYLYHKGLKKANVVPENSNIELCEKSDVENMMELMKQELSPINPQEAIYQYIEIPNEENPHQPFYIFAPLSNRSTIYSTTSQESSTIDDDDEGIEIGRNKNREEVYSNMRRETFCDDKGIVRIERVAFAENVPFFNESVATPAPVSRSNSTTPSKRLDFIMDEIKCTEKKYVEDLAKVIKIYKPYIENNSPPNLKGYQGYLYGNIEKIYRRQRKFLEAIEKCQDIDQIVQCFINNEFLFELYPTYFRNKPKADALLKEFSPIIKEMQEKYEERLDFSAYLLTPVQRMGKYILFLENIEKQLEKLNLPVENAQIALEIVKDEMSKGNDSVAIDSIENSPISKMDYGSFKMREKFNIIKPRKVEGAMVFLFTNVVVFTTTDPRNLEMFYYYDSIKMDDLRIATFDDFTMHLTNFTKSKKKQNSSRYTYILESKSEKIWKSWKEAIEKILWDQLVKAKENSLQSNQNNKKRYKVNRNRIKSAGSSVFYCE